MGGTWHEMSGFGAEEKWFSRFGLLYFMWLGYFVFDFFYGEFFQPLLHFHFFFLLLFLFFLRQWQKIKNKVWPVSWPCKLNNDAIVIMSRHSSFKKRKKMNKTKKKRKKQERKEKEKENSTITTKKHPQKFRRTIPTNFE